MLNRSILSIRHVIHALRDTRLSVSKTQTAEHVVLPNTTSASLLMIITLILECAPTARSKLAGFLLSHL